MAKRFLKLTVDRVDVVDRGANFDPATNDGSHILIMKRDTMPEQQTQNDGSVAAFFTGLMKRLGMNDPDLVAKASEFDAALLSRRSGVILDDVYDRVGALTSVLSSAVYSENPKAVMMRAVKDFSRSIDSALTAWFDETAEKAVSTEPLTEERRKRFQQLAKALTARLDDASDDEGTGAERAAKGDTTMPNENKDTGLSAETIAKAISDALAASLPAAITAANAPIVTTMDALAKRVEASEARTADAEAVAKAERDRREDAEACTVVKGFKSLPMTATPDKDGGLFKRLKKSLDAADYDRVYQILKAADAQISTGRLFENFGADGVVGGETTVGKSAQEEITERAEALCKADPTMKKADAIAAVLKADPSLGKRNRDEHTRRQRQAGATDLNDRE